MRRIARCPQVPRWLAGFIERLHSKLPEDRFESAAEVGELLEASLRHLQDPVACPLPAVLVKPNDAPKSKNHWPKVFLGIAFCIVASVVLAIIWLPRQLAPNINPLPIAVNLVESSQAKNEVAKLDLAFLELATALNQEIDTVEKQLAHSILHTSQIESPAESPAQDSDRNVRDKSELFELEFLDGVKEIEQQLDYWILELKAKGKS